MYATPAQRDRDIAAGALLVPAALREWVERSADELALDLDALTAQQWQRQVRTAQGRTVPATEVPRLRAREVMVHIVDLDASARFADLPADFLAALLDDVTAKRSRSRSGTEPALVLDPSDESRTWAVAGTGRPVRVRRPLATLFA